MMIDQTPDEWLLEEFDRWGSSNESIYIRPMFQVLLDPPDNACTCMFLDMEDEEGFRECEGSINDRSSWSADPDYLPPTWYGVLLDSSSRTRAGSGSPEACNNLFIKLMTEGLGNYSQAQPWGSIVEQHHRERLAVSMSLTTQRRP